MASFVAHSSILIAGVRIWRAASFNVPQMEGGTNEPGFVNALGI